MENKTLSDWTIYQYSNDEVHYIRTDNSSEHLTKETAADGSYKEFSEYWSADQPKLVKEYTALGVLIVTYEYDASGALVNQTDADGTEYTYYANGRMEKKTLPDGTIDEYSNDAVNNIGWENE